MNGWQDIAIRCLGAIICIFLMVRFSMAHLLFPKTGSFRRFLVVLPCFAIAINNFPFLSVFFKEAFLPDRLSHYLFYGVLCLSVGLFEEIAFRGCLFVIILERIEKVKRPQFRVFLASVFSSALFGIVHLTNLLAGASPGSVFLQVGYSFLIGGLCSIMLIKTANIWYCVIFHALYNFAGGIIPEFGEGVIWTNPTVVLTAVVSIGVAIYAFILLSRMRQEEIEQTVCGTDTIHKG